MIFEVEKNLQQKIPIRILYKISTISEMANLMESGYDADDDNSFDLNKITIPQLDRDQYIKMLSVMVRGNIPTVKLGSLIKKINVGGSKKPIFWCFNSPELEMTALSEALGRDQPIFGMYSGNGQLGPEHLPAIAQYYAQEMLSIQPDGPLIIGGNCRGARIAVKLSYLLQELGRTVSHLMLSEYFDKITYGFNGKLLLMFGDKSDRHAQKWFSWGMPGWEKPFTNAPRVEWIRGSHGRFFELDNIGSITGHLRSFLSDKPKDVSLMARMKDFAIIRIHQSPLLFSVYTKNDHWV
jgi:hypothetical protein